MTPSAIWATGWVALLAEGVDRNRCCHAFPLRRRSSPSSRRAWIEIVQRQTRFPASDVALLAEGVDRNLLSDLLRRLLSVSPSSRRAWIEIQLNYWNTYTANVALLAEGVDRNYLPSPTISSTASVALLAEGVDRNHVNQIWYLILIRSPSSRRAWIEIAIILLQKLLKLVALLAEGVDRNIATTAAFS